MSAPDRLLQALRRRAGAGRRRRRVSLQHIWQAFGQACPEAVAGVDARRALAAHLTTLAERQALELPRRAWERTAKPPLPRSVVLLPWVEPPTDAGRDLPEVAWAPELAFARQITGPKQVEALLAVQAFLASGGRHRPLVPERERSAELFDDEKRLESLRATLLFGPGRLSLELLRCFNVSPPLVHEGNPKVSGRPILVLENHHSYHTFCRYNRLHGGYSAVVYGAGKGVLAALGYLRELATEVDCVTLRYFGDLDAPGLRIANDLTERAAHQGLRVVPAGGWYRLLVERGRGRCFRDPHKRSARPQDLAWLPAELRGEAAKLLGQGRRLPQELVGWEVIRGFEGEPARPRSPVDVR